MIRETSAGDGLELRWVKSSYSDSSNSNECVEVATTPSTVHVRDSKNAAGSQLVLTLSAWASFVTYASER
ncbi:DUF397 domain-containing protein [Streptomyces pseudogriseolus]|uniref:DUF397 domain-containing protein n=1 Tax=Streptomyces pseudogriseolus TaxID=36817 RepID=UPI003FA2DDAA